MLRLAIIPFFLVFALATSSFADLKQDQMVSTSVQILKIFNQDYNGSNPHFKLPKRFTRDRIKAIAIIPDLVKSGLLASGLEGEGIFCLRNNDGSWSDPLFIKIKGFGLGVQAGYQSSDAILLFDNTRSYTGLFDGTDTISIGADAAIAGGKGKRYNTDAPKIAANILGLGRSNGFFMGVSVENSRISIADQNNIDYYRRIYLTKDIINGSPRDSKLTKTLKRTLAHTFKSRNK